MTCIVPFLSIFYDGGLINTKLFYIQHLIGTKWKSAFAMHIWNQNHELMCKGNNWTSTSKSDLIKVTDCCINAFLRFLFFSAFPIRCGVTVSTACRYFRRGQSAEYKGGFDWSLQSYILFCVNHCVCQSFFLNDFVNSDCIFLSWTDLFKTLQILGK